METSDPTQRFDLGTRGHQAQQADDPEHDVPEALPSETPSSQAPSSQAPSSDSAGAVRRILHCDMDCFYAQVHMRDDPTLRGKPVVIGGSPSGRGVVAAASYEARVFGIHSAMPAARAVKLCPHAVFLKSDFPRYREESAAIFAIMREMTPIVQPASLDEAYLDVTDHLGRFASATAVAQEIRRRVLEERRLTVSVGVGPNRLIAKIASDYHKPDGLTVVRPHQVQAFLDPMPVRRLHGVGPATEKRLHRHGIETIADIRHFDQLDLEQRFGRFGGVLWRYARGIDDRPVRTHRERKSLGHERTYAQDIGSMPEIEEQIRWLSTKVSEGLQKRTLHARTITLKVRYPDFTTLTRARTLSEPVDDAEPIARTAMDLLRQTDAGSRQRVRLLGVTASSFNMPENGIQLELFLEEPSEEPGGEEPSDEPSDEKLGGALSAVAESTPDPYAGLADVRPRRQAPKR